MELHQVRVLVTLAETGSMTDSAARLGVTQPAVSASLASLEREIGGILFLRSRTGMSLTPLGLELLEKARSILRLEEEMRSATAEERSDTGTIRVAGRQVFMQDVFPRLLHDFSKALPGISIEQAVSGDQDDVIEAFRRGTADIGFAPSPNMKSLEAEVFHQDPVWLAVSKKNPLAKKRNVATGMLADIPLCLPTNSDRLRTPINRFLKSAGWKPKVLLETNDYALMRNLIEQNECAGFIYAHMLASEEGERRIVPLHVEALSIKRDLTVLVRHGAQPHVIRAKEILVKSAQRILSAIKLR